MAGPILGAAIRAGGSALPGIIKGIGGLLPSIFGGLFSRSGQSSANAQNLQIARENRAWQERMSNSAYQRAANDLSAAGLNRILALGSPATTPGGNVATMQNKNAAAIEGATAVQSAKLATQRQKVEIEAIKAGTEKTRTETIGARTRNLLYEHGEEVASVGADIARTVRAMIGNKTPEQIAAIIKREIAKASDKLSRAMETGANTATSLKEVQDDVSMYVNDAIDWVGDTFDKAKDKGRAEVDDFQARRKWRAEFVRLNGRRPTSEEERKYYKGN